MACLPCLVWLWSLWAPRLSLRCFLMLAAAAAAAAAAALMLFCSLVICLVDAK